MSDIVARLFPGPRCKRPAPRELAAPALVRTSHVAGAALNSRLAQLFLAPAGLLLLFLLYEAVAKGADR